MSWLPAEEKGPLNSTHDSAQCLNGSGRRDASPLRVRARENWPMYRMLSWVPASSGRRGLSAPCQRPESESESFGLLQVQAVSTDFGEGTVDGFLFNPTKWT